MKDEKKFSTKKMNDLINNGNRILRILYILFIILLIYVITLIVREWHILSIAGKILSLISPLFIGWFIAWLLHPLARKLESKGLNKGLSSVVAFLLMLIVIGMIIAFIIPTLGDQISDMVSTIPKIVNDITKWIDGLFTRLSQISNSDLETTKTAFMNKIVNYLTGIQNPVFLRIDKAQPLIVPHQVSGCICSFLTPLCNGHRIAGIIRVLKLYPSDNSASQLCYQVYSFLLVSAAPFHALHNHYFPSSCLSLQDMV